MKLKKLTNNHYIITSDDKISEGDWVLTKENTYHQVDYVDAYTKINGWRKITHSTQLLGTEIDGVPFWTSELMPLSLSDCQEIDFGYSVEKMAHEYAKKEYPSELYTVVVGMPARGTAFRGFLEGFNTHKQFVEDKLFTIEQAIQILEEESFGQGAVSRDEYKARVISKLQSLPPKTELFTIEDMKDAFLSGCHNMSNYIEGESENDDYDIYNEAENFIQPLLPKTEWDVKFNEQNKITLI